MWTSRNTRIYQLRCYGIDRVCAYRILKSYPGALTIHGASFVHIYYYHIYYYIHMIGNIYTRDTSSPNSTPRRFLSSLLLYFIYNLPQCTLPDLPPRIPCHFYLVDIEQQHNKHTELSNGNAIF